MEGLWITRYLQRKVCRDFTADEKRNSLVLFEQDSASLLIFHHDVVVEGKSFSELLHLRVIIATTDDVTQVPERFGRKSHSLQKQERQESKLY